MKIKINKDGYLLIKRGKDFSPQFCPRQAGYIYCGDWCPLFGEPKIFKDPNTKELKICLPLCEKLLECNQNTFEDQRPKGE